MNALNLPLLRMELEALAAEYWYETDMRDGRAAPDYYEDDASFVTSVREYSGRAAIEAYYARRRGQSARLTLHVMSNFRLEHAQGETARCRYVLSLHAADGRPVLPSRPPILVSTVEEHLRRQADGRWPYQLRRVIPVFHDGSPSRG